MAAHLRILYVTTTPPSMRNGGGRHCYANLRALSELPSAAISYIGPPIDEPLEGIDRVSRLVARPFRLGDKITAAVSGAATSLVGLYRGWRRRAGGHDFEMAFFETTKLGDDIEALKGAVRTICCVHNVEHDYMAAGSRGWTRLAARNIRRAEGAAIRSADHLLVLHNHDLARLRALYGAPDLDVRSHMHPVCAVGGRPPVPYDRRPPRIVIPGSLDQVYNERGILAFLRECWPALKDAGVELVVAGRNPRPLLRDAVLTAGAALVENPASMDDVVAPARVVVVPDLGGAGMKLRVAEALSLGVPVVGTREALYGYEDAAEFGCAAASASAMAEAIARIVADPSLGAVLAARACEAWERRYSYPAFSKRLREYVHTWLA